MKLALVQLDANDKLWNVEAIPQLLALATDADLMVFPESMPFYQASKKSKTLVAAQHLLCQLSVPGLAFVAGGYVRQGAKLRNAVFLIDQGQVKGVYFKRLAWLDEPIVEGDQAVRFEWQSRQSRFACIPLICADAAENPTPTGTLMMAEALQLGANAETPIIVPSYSFELTGPMWREAMYFWSTGCGAPVAICGVSGKSRHFYLDEQGQKHHFGGGGSAVFWPDGSRTRQSCKRGIYLIDTITRHCQFRRIP
jgi:predicted amidohydrolase